MLYRSEIENDEQGIEKQREIERERRKNRF